MLEQVNSFKYLGVTVNSSGNLDEEIKERAKQEDCIEEASAQTRKVEVMRKVSVPILTYSSKVAK